MLGKGPQVGRLGVNVVHISGELGQELLLLRLRHPAKANSWEKSKEAKKHLEKPPQNPKIQLTDTPNMFALGSSVWDVKRSREFVFYSAWVLWWMSL